MAKIKIIEYVEIQANRGKVFNLITNLEKRMQLSPLWGLARLEGISSDFPQEGSFYWLKFENSDHSVKETIVTDFIPTRKLAYRVSSEEDSQVTWTVQDTPRGTRLIYEEIFQLEETDEEGLLQMVRSQTGQWLRNIKHYLELDRNRRGRFLLWFLDRYYLKLYISQRSAVQVLLIVQFAGLIYLGVTLIAKWMGVLG